VGVDPEFASDVVDQANCRECLTRAIRAAVAAETERCVRIVEQVRKSTLGPHGPSSSVEAKLYGKREACKEIEAAVREGE
jgi:hypothetical protein